MRRGDQDEARPICKRDQSRPPGSNVTKMEMRLGDGNEGVGGVGIIPQRSVRRGLLVSVAAKSA